MGLTSWIDKIYEEKNISTSEITSGKRFILKLIEDIGNLEYIISKYELEVDKNGWIRGSKLFPLTVEIINREEAPGKEVYTKSGPRVCVTYYGICPELENFVSIILWPEESLTSKNTYKKIYGLIKEDHQRRKVLRFSEMFSVELPNKIHPYRDTSVDTINKPKAVYDWSCTPYIKEVGETIFSHKSPICFSKVFLESISELESRYILLKSTVGCIIKKRKNEVTLAIPYLKPTKFRANRCTFKYKPTLKDKIKERKLLNFLIIEKTNGNIQREIYEISPASFSESVAHLLLFDLYNTYLQLERLRVCSDDEYDKKFSTYTSNMEKFCIEYKIPIENPQLCTPDLIYEAYLKPFFKRIEKCIYYSPRFLSEISDENLLLADKTLAKYKSYKKKWDESDYGGPGWRDGFVVSHDVYRLLKLIIELRKFLTWDESYYKLFEGCGSGE